MQSKSDLSKDNGMAMALAVSQAVYKAGKHPALAKFMVNVLVDPRTSNQDFYRVFLSSIMAMTPQEEKTPISEHLKPLMDALDKLLPDVTDVKAQNMYLEVKAEVATFVCSAFMNSAMHEASEIAGLMGTILTLHAGGKTVIPDFQQVTEGAEVPASVTIH